MFLKKTVWIIIFILFHTVFLMQTAYPDKQNFPTYSKFLEKFPDGYPKFSGPGNSKSMGAFKMYLEDLGFKTFENTGNSIGFRFMVYDTNKEKKNNINKTFNLFEGDIKNLKNWINALNFEIKNQITYPLILKKKNISGSLFVNLSLNTNGEILDLSLNQSSGNKTLDNVALQLIKKIKLFPSAGFEAKNKVFNFLIPLNFDLNQN
tara:strand:- start:68 stop:685 length:618 start_codon:yes stop_codon:yes gene_type:complete